jgi:hypothetical protein
MHPRSRDRLQHSALTINITGESHRIVKARKLASKKKNAQESSPSAPPVTSAEWYTTYEISRSPTGKSYSRGSNICSAVNALEPVIRTLSKDKNAIYIIFGAGVIEHIRRLSSFQYAIASNDCRCQFLSNVPNGSSLKVQ